MDWAKVGQVAGAAAQGYTRGGGAGAAIGVFGSLMDKRKKKKAASELPAEASDMGDSISDDNGIKIWGEDEQGNW